MTNDGFDWNAAEADVEEYGGEIDMLSRTNERNRDAYLRELELDPNRYKRRDNKKTGSSGRSSGGGLSPDEQGEGCYIATCVYGSYDCAEVLVLRAFRDNVLKQSLFGQLFVKSYYAISPTLVRWFGNCSWFRWFWRGFLNKVIRRLSRVKNGGSNPSV